MEKFSFFNSINHDRCFNADDFREYFTTFFVNGVFNGSFEIELGDGMGIVIREGVAFIRGARYEISGYEQKRLSLGDSTYTRIDNLVIRLDEEERKVTLLVEEGVPSSSPIAPEVKRSSSFYDLVIAQITVPPTTDTLEMNMIKDTRLDSNLCGIVVSTCKELDTSTAYKQYETQFNEWFESIKGKLDGDVATKLTKQLEDIETKIQTLEDNTLYYDVVEEIEE